MRERTQQNGTFYQDNWIAYDTLGRLRLITGLGGARIEYTYDAVGNRLRQVGRRRPPAFSSGAVDDHRKLTLQHTAWISSSVLPPERNGDWKMTPEALRLLPLEKLLFYVADDLTPPTREHVRQLVERSAKERQWLLGPPKYIELVEHFATRIEDLPVETVGGEFEVYSPHAADELPTEVDATSPRF